MMAKAAGGSGRRGGVPPRKAEDFPVLTLRFCCAKNDGGECSHPPRARPVVTSLPFGLTGLNRWSRAHIDWRNMAEAGWGLRPVHPDRPVFSWWAEGRRWLERAVEGRRRANVIPRGARSGRGALAGGAGQFRDAGDGGSGATLRPGGSGRAGTAAQRSQP